MSGLRDSDLQSSANRVKPAAVPRVRSHFGDIDEFTDAADSWDADFRQLDPGPLRAEMDQIQLPGLLVISAHFDRVIDQTGASPWGARTFALPGRNGAMMRWCGYDMGRTSVMTFAADGEFSALSRPTFDITTFSIADEQLSAAAAALDLADPEELLGSGAQVRQSDDVRFEALHQSLRLIFASAAAPRGAAAEDCVADVAELVLKAVSGAQPEAPVPAGRRRERALRRGLEFIQEFAAEAPTIRSVAAAAGCSQRTLEYAFLDHFGRSPKEYLQALRLNEVRRCLRSGTDTVIADAANLWGFWHMGQFAADYRKFFGELPSETLRGSRRSRSWKTPGSV